MGRYPKAEPARSLPPLCLVTHFPTSIQNLVLFLDRPNFVASPAEPCPRRRLVTAPPMLSVPLEPLNHFLSRIASVLATVDRCVKAGVLAPARNRPRRHRASSHRPGTVFILLHPALHCRRVTIGPCRRWRGWHAAMASGGSGPGRPRGRGRGWVVAIAVACRCL